MKKTKAEQIEAIVPSTLGQNNWKVIAYRSGYTGKIEVVAQEGRTIVETYAGRKCRSWEFGIGMGVEGCGDRRFRLTLDATRLTEKLGKVEIGKMVHNLIAQGLAKEGAPNVITKEK